MPVKKKLTCSKSTQKSAHNDADNVHGVSVSYFNKRKPNKKPKATSAGDLGVNHTKPTMSTLALKKAALITACILYT